MQAQLATLTEYPNFCALNPGTTRCSNMTLSFPLLFYGYNHDWTCPLLSQSDIDNSLNTMITSLSTDVGMLQYGFFFDKDVETAGYPVKLRSMVQLGSPLEGFTSESDKMTDQYRLYEGLFEKWEDPMFKYMGVKHTTTKSAFNGDHIKDGLEVRYWGFDIQQLEFVRVVAFDMSFSMFSLMFVYIWIWMHTGSFFLASIGMLQIVASLPIGNMIYKGVFQIPYFDTLHTLVIFLVLGVGGKSEGGAKRSDSAESVQRLLFRAADTSLRNIPPASKSVAYCSSLRSSQPTTSSSSWTAGSRPQSSSRGTSRTSPRRSTWPRGEDRTFP